jgi:hypothetical protein
MDLLTVLSIALPAVIVVCGAIIANYDPRSNRLGKISLWVQMVLGIILVGVTSWKAKETDDQMGRMDKSLLLDRMENKKTDHLNFLLKPPYLDSNVIYIDMGTNKIKLDLNQYYKPEYLENVFKFNNSRVIKPLVKNGKLFLTIKIYDIEKRIVGEVINNDWRPNLNCSSKYNYDDHGFEVFDNEGRIAFNISLDGNVLKFKGIFYDPETKAVVDACDNGVTTTVYGVSWADSATAFEEKMSAKEFVDKMGDQCQITQLFRYTGTDWVGKRLKN